MLKKIGFLKNSVLIKLYSFGMVISQIIYLVSLVSWGVRIN